MRRYTKPIEEWTPRSAATDAAAAPRHEAADVVDLLHDYSRNASLLRIEYADSGGLPVALVAQPLLVGSGHVVVKDSAGAARTLLMSRIRSVLPA